MPLVRSTFMGGLIVLSQLAMVNCGSGVTNEISDTPVTKTGAGAQAPSSLGINQSSIHSEGGWAQRPVTVYLTRSAPSRVADAVTESIAAWNTAIGMELLVYGGREDGAVQRDLYSPLDDNKTLVYYDTQWAKHTGKPETTLATTLWENAQQAPVIVKGDIILNAETYIFQDSTLPPIDPGRAESIADTQSVMTHEFGHLLGLDHVARSIDPDSVMHAQTVIGLNEHRRLPSAGDVELMLSIYNK